MLQKGNGMDKLCAVIIDLHHFFYPLQPQYLFIGQPFCVQYFIRRLFHITDTVFRRLFPHAGPLQNFQEAQLKLIRAHAVNPVKGISEAFIIFIRKPRNQIQMLMDVPAAADSSHRMFQLFQVHCTPDCLKGHRVHRLNADFQLCQPRSETIQKRRLLLPQKVCGNLKMKVCDTIVMFQDVLPDRHCMGMAAIEGPVNKLYLSHFIVQKKLQLSFYDTNVTHPDTLFHRRQAIAAAKRTPPAGLVIQDFIFKRLQVMIQERNGTQVHRFPGCRITCGQTQARNFLQAMPYGFALFLLPHRFGGTGLFPCRTCVIFQQFPEGRLTFPHHNTCQLRISPENLPRVIGNLRSPQPQGHAGQKLGQLTQHFLNQPPIPNVTGKTNYVGFSDIYVR